MSENHPFAGWELDTGFDPFEDHNGPIYRKRDENGGYRCGFVAERRHCNGMQAVHGAMYLLLADYALFAIARDRMQDQFGVTVSLNADFTAAASEGDVVLASGEVIHETGKMLFVRGTIYTDKATVLGFSGIIRRVRV